MSPRCLLCALALPLTSCGLFQKPAYEEQGMASYIADHYTGRPTSSGQIYQPYAHTAAHYSLPFGTQVSVTNLQTGQQVKVTVNDRFPFYPGRVINLSSAAAQAIGIPYQRMAQVKVTARSVANQVQSGYAYGYQQRAPAPAYQARRQPAQSYGTPAASNQRLPDFSGPAPAYQPPARTYQPQPPAGNNSNYLPGFNSGAPPAGAGLR
jgi:rare lipoprotein A